MLTDLWAAVSVSAMKSPKVNKYGTAAGKEVLELLRKHPEGLDASQIRAAVGGVGSQEQLLRRLRYLYKFFDIDCVREGKRYVYYYRGEKDEGAVDSGAISGAQRARILNLAKGTCQMCGRTVADDGIRLQIDHKIPQTWGGKTVDENLWAICVQCNHGKRDHFKSYDATEMRSLVSIESVHERIAQLLRMHLGHPVDSRLIQDVANATEQQEDWQKRLRELRYDVIGLDIKVGRRREAGYTRTTYTLLNWRDLPADHARLIRLWEKKANRPELRRQLGLV